MAMNNIEPDDTVVVPKGASLVSQSRYKEQMEDDRRLRMAREMREIAHPQPRRSTIGAFSANGLGGFTSYDNDGSVSSFGNFDQPAVGDPDDEMRGAYNGIVDAANLAAGTRRHRAQTTLASMYGQAMKNGGMVPKSLAPALRKELGLPNLVGGTVAKDGTFMLLGDNGNGSIAPVGLVSPSDVMRASIESKDVDTADAIYNSYLRGRFTPEQIGQLGYSAGWSTSTRQGKAVERNSLAQQRVQNDSLKILVDLWNKDRGQIPSIDRFLSSLPKGYLEVVTAGDYERDKDGNLIPDENGGYQRKQLSPAEMADKAMEFYNGMVQKAQGMGGGGGDPFKSEILNLIRQQMAPQRPAVDPREQEIVDSRMNRAVDAERRRDIMSRPQQLVYYKTADGNFASGNGWTRGDKVYDAEGREIAGAIPTDRNGAELPESAEARTRAAQAERRASVLPAAADLGGGESWTPGSDLRNDGKTYKGTGWLGVLRLPNGGVASEYTVGVDIGGKEMDIPTLVPTLTQDEVDLMVNDIIPNGKSPPDAIMQKAVDHAKSQLAKGESVFINDGQPGQGQPTAPKQNGGFTMQDDGTLKMASGRVLHSGDIVTNARGQTARWNGGGPRDWTVLNKDEAKAARNAALAEYRAKRRRNGMKMPEKPSIDSTSSNQNQVGVSNSTLRASNGGRDYTEKPMLPAERRKGIEKRWKEYQWQQKQLGNDLSDEYIEQMIDKELDETIG